ncbi:MAG: hypothetical protein WA210_13295 [Burkholderiaceae bacterium]
MTSMTQAGSPVPTHAPRPVAPRDSARVFISGHSLTDNPLPDDLAAIAQSLGTPVRWNQQNVVGSQIKVRTRGDNPAVQGWPGYRSGKNREGQGMDVVRELREPQTLGGERYDTLIIAENHVIIWSLTQADTVRHLRHFHDRFIEGNSQGQTYFYEAWLGIDNKSDPRDWIAYERAASPIWQCIATRINHSLAAEGRADRIASLPAGAALAELVERATQGPGVPGVSASSVRETVDRIVNDDVHLTRLGVYYMALVTYAAVFNRSPQGAWAPDGVTSTQAKSLQEVAWAYVAAYSSQNTPLGLGQCRALMCDSFCNTYNTYRRSPHFNQEIWRWWSNVKRLRESAGCRWLFSRESQENPFYFSPDSDASYWYPAP